VVGTHVDALTSDMENSMTGKVDKDQRQGWLRELKMGDPVLLYNHYYGYSKHTVDKITPAGKMDVNGVRYSPSGWTPGAGSLKQATPERLEAIEKRKIIRSITVSMDRYNRLAGYNKERNLKSISLEELMQIENTLTTWEERVENDE